MKTYGSNVGVEFEWGVSLMFMFGVEHRYKAFVIALGPFFLEWTW